MLMTTKTTPMTRRSIALAAAAAAVTFGLTGSAWAQAKDPVKVGLLSSKSGVFAQQGEEVIRAIKFAIEEANAKGGVDGRKVEVAEADDEGTPDAGRRVGEKLARDGYNLLIGAIPSSISLALGPNLERWDAAYFVVASKSDKITGDSCKPRMFRTNHSDAMDIAMIAEWAKGFKEKTFASMAADYVWGRDSAESFAKAVKAQGKEVKLQLYAPLGTKDFSPFIAQLKEAKVDAIWVAETGRDAIAFVKQAAEFGLIPQTKLIGHSLILNFMINGTDKLLEGTPGTTGYTPDIDNPAQQGLCRRLEGQVQPPAHRQRRPGLQRRPGHVRRRAPGQERQTRRRVQGPVRRQTRHHLRPGLTMRAADNQLVLPNYVGRAKVADGVLRPVIEQSYPASLAPAASALCKM
jgi:branched-chain amino acid transport system substrate-binding protein